MGRKVAVDVRLLEASGIGRYLREVVSRLVTRGSYRYTLLGDPQAIAQHVGGHPGVSAVRARAPIYSLSEQLELLRRIAGDTDLYWAPHYNVPLVHPGRLLVTVHDVLHLALPEYAGRAHRRLYARLMFQAATRRAAAILCVSRFTAEEVVRHTGISRHKVRVVHNGVGPEWFSPPGGEPPHPRPYFLFVGNVKPHKNLGRLVAAFELASASLPHDLVIVGRREGFLTGDDEVARRAEALGGRVRFTGEVPERELRRFVANATALVFPSVYEGFGLPPLEAMASGCPALVSRAAALPEVCGKAALYFDPFDVEDIARALVRVATEEGLRAELVERGREHASRFSWDRCAEDTEAVIEEVLGG